MKYIVIKDNEPIFEKLKRKAKETIQKVGDFVVRNKEEIILFAPMIIGGLTVLVKTVGKHINLRKEESVKELYCYDNRLGHYWALKRELSNKEWLEIDSRKKKGERLGDILDELKVLK